MSVVLTFKKSFLTLHKNLKFYVNKKKGTSDDFILSQLEEEGSVERRSSNNSSRSVNYVTAAESTKRHLCTANQQQSPKSNFYQLNMMPFMSKTCLCHSYGSMLTTCSICC